MAEDLRTFHGSAVRLSKPTPYIAVSLHSVKHPGLWAGLHSAPFFTQLLSVHRSSDMVGIRTSSPIVAADVGYLPQIGPASIGPYLSVGFGTAELGLQGRWLRDRVGVEWRTAWFAPHSVGTSMSLCVRLGKAEEGHDADPGPRS